MPDIAGVVVYHIIRSGHEQAFIDWSKRMGDSVHAAAGFRSPIRLDQGPAISHTLVQFNSQEQLDNWLRSEALWLLLRAESVNYSLKTIKPHVGQTSAVKITGPASTPKWKHAAATWLSVYPTLVAVNILMIRPLSGSVNWLLLTGSSIVLTVILTWVILPRAHQALRPWMFSDPDKESSR